MDQSLRNKLRNVVTQCRRHLEDAVAQALQGQFGIYATGKKDEVRVDDAGRMGHLTAEDRQYREQVLVHLDHIQAGGIKPQDEPTKPALDQLIREVAFTHLNRLCAYKMMECRGLIREAVSRGLKSQGFLFYLADHEADNKLHSTGQQDVAYRHFLNWLGGTLSEEIGVLFSPHDPANRLFPPQRVLDEVLALLNSDDLKDIWTEDEAIGWVYQYFTPKELRDQARKESAAPRNSYELAFRNQFFTPRYVVEFLTDNTLGRIWYEMRKGNTALKDRCRYLVRRPTEVFLGEEETAPVESEREDTDLPQEDLLKQPVYIPHRPKKDPRDIKVLDPACGSGHFLLYCFALLLVIYEEAYADPDLGPALKKDYPTLDDLQRAVPGLILSRNLHGIDIDLRATQIAALALWLRAQRAYQEMGFKKDRPKITRSNIVCAEPMPGEKDLLEGFLKTLHEDRLEALIRRVMQVPAEKRIRATAAMADRLCELVRLVWEKMQLAGEAGSLLKIEEELQEAIREGQEEFEEKNPLFRVTEYSLTEQPTEHYFRFVPGDVEGDRVSFWDMAERLVLGALQDYAAYAANGNRLKRQLFVEDAVRGFAFVDLCRQRFDVALMNPPFGAGTPAIGKLLQSQYEGAHNDLLATFVVRGISLCRTDGMLGAITSRSCLVGRRLSSFREAWMLPRLDVLLDLGKEVMDEAMVQSCAYTLRSPAFQTFVAFDARSIATQDRYFSDLFSRRYIASSSQLQLLPRSRVLYSIPGEIHALLQLSHRFEPAMGTAREGMKSFVNQRFLRIKWEVPPNEVGTEKRWKWYVKGGEAMPYRSDVSLVLDWADDGRALKEINRALNGSTAQVCQASSFWFRSGCTYSRRSSRMFAVRLLPAGCVFSDKGPAILPESGYSPWFLLGFFNSKTVRGLVHLQAHASDYHTGIIKTLPVPDLSPPTINAIETTARELFTHKLAVDSFSETDSAFIFRIAASLEGAACLRHEIAARYELRRGEGEQKLSNLVQKAFHIPSIDWLDHIFGDDEIEVEGQPDEDDEGELLDNILSVAQDAASYVVGCLFGRWDCRRLSPGTAMPVINGKNDPPSVCSPGMLTGSDGLPAREAPSSYPLRIEWDGILLDDPDHSDDIVRRVCEVIELIWKDRADAIEKEACGILGVKELRDYFRKPGSSGFWDDHVKRYSKSRRKAPIYWLLQSSKKNYALWLYYHRLDKDILFKALENYVRPKVRLEDDRLKSLRTQRTGATGKDAKQLDRQIEKQEAFLSELRDFEEKLKRAADLHLAPDLNDGVVLNIAPLWELVPWKEAKAYWQELLAGSYEWSTIGKQLREKGLVK